MAKQRGEAGTALRWLGGSPVNQSLADARHELRAKEEELAKDLSDMHIDLWSLKALYSHLVSARVAHALRTRLEAAKADAEHNQVGVMVLLIAGPVWRFCKHKKNKKTEIC